VRRKLKHIWQEIAKRGIFIVAVLLLGVSVLFTWFLVTGFSQSQAMITIGIAAVSAVFAAISSIAGLMQATEAQRQRENQERPYITAYFEGTHNGFLYFEIQNAGNSPAVDVIFRFEPEPIDYSGRKLTDISLFNKPISFMPQGKAYRQVIDASHKFLAEGRPTKYQIRTVYNSISGQLFDEITNIDLEYLKQTTLPGKTTEDNLEDISKQLKELTQIFRSTRGMNSFLVETPTEYRARLQVMNEERKELPRWKMMVRNLLENALKIINR
jgi:hypothetical protein